MQLTLSLARGRRWLRRRRRCCASASSARCRRISNLLAALREGDYSIRARGAGRDDALGLALLEVNALSETLRAQRLRALEATALLRAVIEEIDVAVFAFDERAAAAAGESRRRAAAGPARRAAARTQRARTLGLERCLDGESPRTLDATFPGGAGRWEVRRGTSARTACPHQLLVLSDLSRALRAEERSAWQRLVRVLGHEINNSLAPDQVDRRQPREPLAARRRARPTGSRTSARACR